MIHFIFGGLYQGQREYVEKHYGEAHQMKSIDDFQKGSVNVIFPAELFFADLSDEQVEELFKSIEGGLVIVGNEIGMGVVPMDKTQRLHRDKIGWHYQNIAKQSDRITRCFMGIAEELR